MRAAPASIRAVIASFAALLGATASGCAAVAPGLPIGMSDAPAEHPTAKPAAAMSAPPWADYAAARAWPEAAPAAASFGHRRDKALVHVRVEPNALAAYRALSTEAPMPDGARVVAWHETLSGVSLGGYLLEKRGGAWSAREIDAHGALVAGEHPECVRCHDMAPTDHLFGVPSAKPAQPAVEESIAPAVR